MRIPPRFAMALWLTCWLAATAACLAITRPLRAEINVDEIYWIGSTYYYHLAFHERDWSHPDWKLVSAQENPQIARYWIGARLALAGQHVVNREMLSCFRQMFHVPADKFAAYSGRDRLLEDIGDVTPDRCARPMGGPGVTRKGALLTLSRQALVACAVLASLVMFFFGAAIADRATGLVASQLLLLHPLAVDAYSHAMSDGVAMMFAVAAAYASWEFFRAMADARPVSRRRAISLVLASGVLLALACGAKLNALIVVFLFGAGALVASALAWRRRDLVRSRLTIALGAATAVVFLTVYSLSNPAIMIDIVPGLLAPFTTQKEGLAYMQDLMPDRALRTLPQKFEAVTHVATGPLTFTLFSVFALMAAIRRPRAGVWFVAGWWLIAVVVVTGLIPFAWQRYVLPVAIPSVLLLAYAITSTAGLLGHRLKRSPATFGPAS